MIQTPKGEKVFLETQPSCTIKYLKSMIHKKIGVPADEQKLIFSGSLLKDEHTLSAYNIQYGDTVTMNYSTGIRWYSSGTSYYS